MGERYDYGPLRTYQIIWKSGHVETVQGHQVTFGSDRVGFTSSLFAVQVQEQTEPRFTIHGEFDGRWRMVISAPEAELVSVRDVTDSETEPATEAGAS